MKPESRDKESQKPRKATDAVIRAVAKCENGLERLSRVECNRRAGRALFRCLLHVVHPVDRL